MTSLESRYRRLLAIYPREHRRMYEEEMIGVLMAGATPDRSRPSLPELADLVLAALAVRLRRIGSAAPDERWRRAAYSGLLFGSLALLILSVDGLTAKTAIFVHYRAVGATAPTSADWLSPALWALALTAGLLRWRRFTAVSTLAALAAECLRVSAWYAWSPSEVLNACWLLTGAAVVAGLAGWSTRAERQPRPRGLWPFAAAGAVMAAAGVLSVTHSRPDSLFTQNILIFGRYLPIWDSIWSLILPVLALALTWWRQPAAERLRLLAFAVPVLAMILLVPLGYGGFMYASQQDSQHPIYLAGFQWVILVAVPALAFAVAVLAVGRYERIRHLVKLGRAAEQREVAPER